jgi:hypothetical protein
VLCTCETKVCDLEEKEKNNCRLEREQSRLVTTQPSSITNKPKGQHLTRRQTKRTGLRPYWASWKMANLKCSKDHLNIFKGRYVVLIMIKMNHKRHKMNHKTPKDEKGTYRKGRALHGRLDTLSYPSRNRTLSLSLRSRSRLLFYSNKSDTTAP